MICYKVSMALQLKGTYCIKFSQISSDRHSINLFYFTTRDIKYEIPGTTD